MAEERQKRLEQLFHAALDLPSEQRAPFLDEHCGDDAELRAEVESFLAHDSADTQQFQPNTEIDAEELLDELGPRPGAQTDATLDLASVPEAAGSTQMPERIGAYKILEILGEGGMGVVYRARQESPQRIVALKVIKPGFTSRQVLRRFQHETSLLGRLQHVGIAQIYEAGTANVPGLGVQPFFAMEFLRGRSLTDYADAAGAGVAERLELIAKVCDAVEYAHRNSVIHRDLKPGNILVDDSGQPKILDFGVARATDADIQMTTMQTAVGQLVGTVPYMSPEQISGDPNEIDTRSDVYALGVNLYELLAGHLPFDLSNKSLFDAARIIRDDAPTQLSTISRNFRGDVETIVTKALEKDKERRYQSASALAADLRRYLADEPILARPPSTIYQFRKFAKRNKTLVASVVVIFAVLVAGLVVSTSQYLRAEQQRVLAENARVEADKRRVEAVEERDAKEAARRAEAEQRILAEQNEASARRETAKLAQVNRILQDLLGSVNPVVARGREITVREILDAASKRIARRSGKIDPEVEADVRTTIGKTYLRLARFTDAEPHLEKALEIRRGISDGLYDDAAEALSNLAELRRAQGRLDDAGRLMQSAVDLLQSLYGFQSTQVAAALHNLAVLQKEMGNTQAAEESYRQVIAIRRVLPGDARNELAGTLTALGALLQEQGQYEAAEQRLREALELRRELLPPNHPQIATSLGSLGYLLAMRQQFVESDRLLDEALQLQRKTLPANHPSLAITLTLRGAAWLEAGRALDAEASLRESLAIRQRKLPDGHWLIASARSLLGECLTRQNRFREAEPLLLDGYNAMAADATAPPLRTRQALERVIALYELSDHAEQAAQWREKLDGLADSSPEKASKPDRD